MAAEPSSSSGLGQRRHELEQRDREEAACYPADDGWSDRIHNPDLSRAFWDDPEPTCTGVLTGDRIRKYHYEVGRMIRPFQEKHLNAASYDLTLGPRCVLDGQEVILDPKRRILRIPPSTIVLVTSREILLMPHWLVATFNLKSKFIFEGLLMGAGPQIDPGYKGVLTCPLHNISSKTIEIELCTPFAKLDFVKTSWDSRVSLGAIASEKDLYVHSEGGQLLTDDGEAVRLWPDSKNYPAPVSHLAGSEGAKSSLRKLESSFEKLSNDFGGLQRGVRMAELAGVILAVTVIAAVIGLAAVLISYTDGKVDAVRKEAVAPRSESPKAKP